MISLGIVVLWISIIATNNVSAFAPSISITETQKYIQSIDQTHRRMKPSILINDNLRTPTLSMTSSSSENNPVQKNPNNKFSKFNPVPRLQRILVNFQTISKTFWKRFKLLSKPAKLIVVAQMLMLTLIFGSMGRKAYFVATGNKAGMTRVASRRRPIEIPYSTFLDLADQQTFKKMTNEQEPVKLNQVVIGRERISFRVEPTEKKMMTPSDSTDKKALTQYSPIYTTTKPSASQDLMDFLRSNQISFRAASTKQQTMIATTLRSALLCVYLLFIIRMYRTMSGGGGGPGGSGGIPGKLASKRKLQNSQSQEPLVTFQDIEGVDKAKFEVMEFVDTLRNPSKYAILGARAPKGLLLEGPPGTGKTMLARATAATAGVPLLYCSGSDFVEMFVGRGAARVRKTFEKAAKLSPCIIFVDELDALGKSRDMGAPGMRISSNDEAEQTLNQLLACMDGLDSTKGVCVLAATNRREVLDPALLRPGRFDRIVKVTLPDVKGREKILRVHASKLPGFEEGTGVDPERLGSLGNRNKVDLSAVASVTNGLSGAELDYIVNEAAIRAVRRVSARLQEGKEDPSTIVPTVIPQDFEGSVANFFETRKSNNGVGDFIGSVFKK